MQNIWKLYAIRFFHNLIPAYVIERLFWEQRGMTIQMVVYTEIIYAVTVVLLEIPTGIIADKWGRKKMVVINAFFGCCEFFILVFATQFWHFAVVVFLAGVGRSACSGSENALLYDSLLSNGEAQSFEKYIGRLNMCDFSAAILAALSGSLMASRFGFELNYWVSFAGMFVSLCISLMLVEPDIKSKPDEPVAVKEYVKASVYFFRKNPGVCLVLLSGMVTGAALNFIDEFWQLYMSRLGIPVIYFGLFSAGLMFLRLPGNMFAYAIKNRFSYRTLLSGVVFVFASGFLYLSAVKGYTSLVAIFLICIVSGIIEPIATGYLHHRIDSSMRATIDSFQSLGLRAVLIIVGLGFGFFSTRVDIFGGYGFISFICGVFFVYFLMSSKEIVEQ
jgi:MFS family permease